MHPRAEEFLREASPHALMVPWEDDLMTQFGVKTTSTLHPDTVVLVQDSTIPEAMKMAQELGLERIKRPRKTYVCDRSSSTISYKLGKVAIDRNGYRTPHVARLVLVPMSWAGLTTFDVLIPEHLYEEDSPNHVCTLKLQSLCKALFRLATKDKKMSDFTVVYGSQLRNVLLSQVYGRFWRDLLGPEAEFSDVHKRCLQKGLAMLQGWECRTSDERVMMEKILRERIPVSEFFKQSKQSKL